MAKADLGAGAAKARFCPTKLLSLSLYGFCFFSWIIGKFFRRVMHTPAQNSARGSSQS